MSETMVGRENVYTCRVCLGYTVTVHVDDGVTPMFIVCRATPACAGMATSAMYPTGPRPSYVPAPTWEWYKPTRAVLLKMDAGTRDHVKRGGLLLRQRRPTKLE